MYIYTYIYIYIYIYIASEEGICRNVMQNAKLIF